MQHFYDLLPILELLYDILFVTDTHCHCLDDVTTNKVDKKIFMSNPRT